jgi:hypothetical protein
MSSFSFSRLFPSWFSPPSAPSVDNVMDEHLNTPSVEPNPSLNKTKRPKQTKTKTAKAKRQEVSSSFDDVTMKDAAPNPTLSVDNVEVEDATAMGNPTIQDIEHCDATKLAKWIQQVLDPPLNPRNIEKIVEAEIDGPVFLKGAGDQDFFMRAGFSFGASVKLSELAKGFTIQGKLLSFIPYSKH